MAQTASVDREGLDETRRMDTRATTKADTLPADQGAGNPETWLDICQTSQWRRLTRAYLDDPRCTSRKPILTKTTDMAVAIHQEENIIIAHTREFRLLSLIAHHHQQLPPPCRCLDMPTTT